VDHGTQDSQHLKEANRVTTPGSGLGNAGLSDGKKDGPDKRDGKPKQLGKAAVEREKIEKKEDGEQ